MIYITLIIKEMCPKTPFGTNTLSYVRKKVYNAEERFCRPGIFLFKKGVKLKVLTNVLENRYNDFCLLSQFHNTFNDEASEYIQSRYEVHNHQT